MQNQTVAEKMPIGPLNFGLVLVGWLRTSHERMRNQTTMMVSVTLATVAPHTDFFSGLSW